MFDKNNKDKATQQGQGATQTATPTQQTTEQKKEVQSPTTSTIAEQTRKKINDTRAKIANFRQIEKLEKEIIRFKKNITTREEKITELASAL